MTAIVTFFRLCATAAILCMIAGAFAVHGRIVLVPHPDGKTLTIIEVPEQRVDTFIRPVPSWTKQWEDSLKIKERKNERNK